MQDQDPTNDAFNCYFTFAKYAWKGHDVPLLLAKVSHFVPANKSMSVLSSVPKSKLPEMEHDDLVDSVIQLWARADRAGGDLKDCGPTHILPALNSMHPNFDDWERFKATVLSLMDCDCEPSKKKRKAAKVDDSASETERGSLSKPGPREDPHWAGLHS